MGCLIEKLTVIDNVLQLSSVAHRLLVVILKKKICSYHAHFKNNSYLF